MFFSKLNAVVDYIDSHLESELDRQALARRAGMSFDTLRRIFPHLAGVTMTEYLRRRRMTMAGRDLVQGDNMIIDIAAKYGYESAASFSRAFQKFHGVSPSKAKVNTLTLKYFPKLTFRRPPAPPTQSYEILELGELQLYGLSIHTDFHHVNYDAPHLFAEVEKRYVRLGHPDFAMLAYHRTRESEAGYEYWVFWQRKHRALRPYAVPAARWLRVRVPSQEAVVIQRASDWFYNEFLPDCPYRLRLEPELEHYHDGVTDLLFPIR